MKRLFLPLVALLLIVGCSRKDPTPTSLPSPTVADVPPAVPTLTPTPAGSPVPRITVVPSATRFPTTPEGEPQEATAPPTRTPEASPTETPRPTATIEIIDAGPTATVAESPLAEPTVPESPLPAPAETEPTDAPDGEATTTPSSDEGTPTTDEDTPSPTLPMSTATADEADITPTATDPSPTSPTPTITTAPGEAWRVDNLFSYYDVDFDEFLIWGEVVNQSDTYQRVTLLTPVLYDEQGTPITSEDDVEPVWGYEQLLDMISLAPEQSLAFSFLVYLPLEVAFDEDFEILVEGEPAEDARNDLDIVRDDYDSSDWPEFFYVDGAYENPGPDLSAYIAVVVTVYDADERVIGVGWSLESDADHRGAGEHEFDVTVELWEIVDYLEWDVYTYKVQVIGR